MIYYQGGDEKNDMIHEKVPPGADLVRCIRIFFLLFIPTVLFSCVYQSPQGQWINLGAESLYLETVVLDKNAIASNYKNVCIEARESIQEQLSEHLPARVLPLHLYLPGALRQDNTSASIQILITNCKVDVQQWDVGGGEPSFTYYLDLDVRVTVEYMESRLLEYKIQTFEQISADTSGSLFEFDFGESVARTLLLFDGKRLLVPD